MIDLYGDYIQTAGEYAKVLVLAGMAEPMYKIQVNSLDFQKCHISFQLMKDGEKFTSQELYSPGLYAIFDLDRTPEMCLYVGHTDNSVYHRIRRFLQGATRTLRADETHAAGRLCNRYNVDYHSLGVKFLPKAKFPHSHNRIYNERFIDEYIAPLVNAQYNQKIKK